MGMKTFTLVVKSMKVGLLAIAAYVVFKLIATFYFGYKDVQGEYGGAYFYNWSVKYMDNKLSKSAYMPSKLEEQRNNKTYTDYWNKVQKEGIPEEFLYPLYADRLPDTFVTSPKKTWKLFDTTEKLNLEYEFLKMRARFIAAMFGTKYDAAQLKHLQLDKNNSLRLDSKFFKKMDGKKIKAFFADEKNTGVFDAALFETIVANLLKNKAEYGVRWADNAATMTPAFEADVMKLVNKTFAGMDIKVEDVNSFYKRFMTLQPTPMDVHIANRIKLAFLYMNSYLDADKAENEAYNELRKRYAGIEAEAESETKMRKLKSTKAKMDALRMELIYNKSSALFSQTLGMFGPLLAKKDDNRSWYRRFGGPRAATEKLNPKHKNIKMFDDQIKGHLAI